MTEQEINRILLENRVLVVALKDIIKFEGHLKFSAVYEAHEILKQLGELHDSNW